MNTQKFKFYILIGIFCTCISALSQPLVKTKIKYYYISPNSVDDIRASLNRKSPIKEKKKIFHGHTEWKVKWAFWWKESWRKCTIDGSQASLNLIYTYPKLSERYVNDEIFNKFMTYEKALKEHEEKHGAIGLEAAKEVEQALKEVGSERTCELLASKANTAAKEIIRKYKKVDDAFDKITKHGKTEGVSLD